MLIKYLKRQERVFPHWWNYLFPTYRTFYEQVEVLDTYNGLCLVKLVGDQTTVVNRSDIYDFKYEA
jgi:hypothetical protein